MLNASDDAPKGYYKEMKKNGTMPQVSAAASFRTGAMNLNTWVLFIQYACCFGVELTMNNAAGELLRKKDILHSTKTSWTFKYFLICLLTNFFV